MSTDFKQTLWKAADKLRAQMDAAEYKHIVLGLIFLKYISDTFVKQQGKVKSMVSEPSSDYFISEDAAEYAEELEERDYYIQDNVFWVPQEARWENLRSKAKQPDIGSLVDSAMTAIENENTSLRGKLDKRFGRAQLGQGVLGELIDLISTIGFADKYDSSDLLGEVYEYFLGKFASAEGKKGGQYYTPSQVVKTLVAILSPNSGRVYDPCCGSGGMFVQSEEFVKAHGGRVDDISIYGQESNPTTWRLAAMNLAIRGFSADLGKENDDTFARDQFPDVKFDYIMANPPFNISDWGGEKYESDPRWQFGRPPVGNANYAWLQHILWKLKPDGVGGVVLANMSLSSNDIAEETIRVGMIENDVIECIVNLPDKLFSTTPIGACLWILNKNKPRKNEILFIDASHDFEKVNRTENFFPESSIQRISESFRTWRTSSGQFKSVPNYANAATTEEVLAKHASLFPAAYLDFTTTDSEKHSWGVLPSPEDNAHYINSAIEDLSKLGLLNKDDLLFKKYKIGDLLEHTKEKLGDRIEPEILTCTETTGLVLQKDRFANRVATENTSKYKLVREGDVVYNPYLLWAGSIDQCWIVEEGITSPAYEIFRVKDGIDKGLIGLFLKTPKMLARYDGISVGTVKRRRRAPPERFLELEIEIPVVDGIDLSSVLVNLRQLEQSIRTIRDELKNFARGSHK